MKTLHPGVVLAAWLVAILLVQSLNGRLLALALLTPIFFGQRVLLRGIRLCWRARWLLATLFLVFSFGVPGEPLWIMPVAPTWEGLQEAGNHLGRLLLVLCFVALLLETMPLEALLVALHWWLSPLQRVKCDSERFVIRLSLVLRYVEHCPKPRDWRFLLDAAQHSSLGEKVLLHIPPLGKRDCLFMLMLLIFAATFLVWQIAP